MPRARAPVAGREFSKDGVPFPADAFGECRVVEREFGLVAPVASADGRMFAVEHYGIEPDMWVIGTGLGGGIFPLAALLAQESLNRAMPDKALGHYTHEKNPVACAAGLATLEVIEQEGLVENARRLGAQTLERWNGWREKHPLIGDVRGLGLLLGIELVKNRATGERAIDAAEAVMYQALSKGLNFKLTMGNILTLTPALTLTEAEMARASAILDQCLTAVETEQAYTSIR